VDDIQCLPCAAGTDGGAAEPARPARRALLALGVAGTLGACGGGRRPAPSVAVPTPRDTDLGRMIADPRDPIAGANAPNARVLRRFYARHGFRPVWTSRPAQAEALVDAVLRAGEHGLEPELFRAGLLQRREAFSPLRRDLLLSDAFLSYADALAHGAVPAERRRRHEALAPEPVDLATALDEALDSRDPAAAIEALAPATPGYRALREALRAPPAAGRTRAAQAAAQERRRALEVNLERERWLPRPLPAERVWVNVPDQQLVLYRGDAPAFSTRVVVGDNAERNQSPEFDALIEASFFNPPWIVPADIVTAEILPKLEREPDYLARNNMVMRDNGEVEQLAGPGAGLGYLLFDMPNRFDVFLHDTPDRFLFGRSNRRMSRGCIRVQQPRELAALLMRQPVEAIDQKIEIGETARSALPRPVPVFVTYQTAFADAQGVVQFRPDFYNRDAELWRRLRREPEPEPEPPAPVQVARQARPVRAAPGRARR
jgi:murein L,D-transpeptidase YcbB/YkuD